MDKVENRRGAKQKPREAGREIERESGADRKIESEGSGKKSA